LGGRKGIRPVKTEWWGAGMVICLERGAELAQLMPLPLTVSCSSKIQIGCMYLLRKTNGILAFFITDVFFELSSYQLLNKEYFTILIQ